MKLPRKQKGEALLLFIVAVSLWFFGNLAYDSKFQCGVDKTLNVENVENSCGDNE